MSREEENKTIVKEVRRAGPTNLRQWGHLTDRLAQGWRPAQSDKTDLLELSRLLFELSNAQ